MMDLRRWRCGSLALWPLFFATTSAFANDDSPHAPALNPSAKRTLKLLALGYRYVDADLPRHFQSATARRFDNTPSENPITDAGATLGRVLFYDTRLSANDSISCASCHEQKYAFADPNRYSTGYLGKRTDRNAMSLVELRYARNGRFFWDERASSLEIQVLMPAQSHIEMGQSIPRLLELLSGDSTYPDLYRAAFGDSQITEERTARAMAQFLRSMVSYQSKYDEGRAKVRSIRDHFDGFTAGENRGKSLFLINCASCHLPEGQDAHFNVLGAMNTGLDKDLSTVDGGVGDITLQPEDVGRFRSSSLRNVEKTAPYMHDGRFATLEEVIDHYANHVNDHPNLDRRIRRQPALTGDDATDIIAFLKTLTDHQFLSDLKFSDPFQ